MNTRKHVAALAATVALIGGVVAASPAHAATASNPSTTYVYHISGKSKSGNTTISGTYSYRVTGHTSAGENIYGDRSPMLARTTASATTASRQCSP